MCLSWFRRKDWRVVLGAWDGTNGCAPIPGFTGSKPMGQLAEALNVASIVLSIAALVIAHM